MWLKKKVIKNYSIARVYGIDAYSMETYFLRWENSYIHTTALHRNIKKLPAKQKVKQSFSTPPPKKKFQATSSSTVSSIFNTRVAKVRPCRITSCKGSIEPLKLIGFGMVISESTSSTMIQLLRMIQYVQ
jgi:hypothetical protein